MFYCCQKYISKNIIYWLLAVIMLLAMFFLAFFSMQGDSAIMDEVAHLPAGYSYVTQQDMRLNPEHPPLIKDWAGLGVLFGSKLDGFKVNFPAQIKAWRDDVNGQWDFGFNFLYHSHNPADKIIFWGRLPMLLLLIILGFYILIWTKEIFSFEAALLSLFLYSFSPTFLAHGRFVTTDVAAAAGFFITLYYFTHWLKKPNKKNLIFTGLFFGLAELSKFSLVLLIPLMFFLALIWVFVKKNSHQDWWMLVKDYLGGLILIFIIGYGLVYLVYLFHIWHYSPERQARDIKFILSSSPLPLLAKFDYWLAHWKAAQPIAQYLFGVLMVFQRVTGGNTTYFLGLISASGWKIYFPVVYFIKEPLAMHFLALIALLFGASLIKMPFWQNTWPRFKQWTRGHLAELVAFSMLVLYWMVSLKSNLNIGVRHILPTFPFVYLLASGGAVELISFLKKRQQNLFIFGISVLGILITWQLVSVCSVYPSFLAYFNELAGGPSGGYRYVVDSNLDWGQDLKRLAAWAKKNQINNIYLDYFGGGDPEYYLGKIYHHWAGNWPPNKIKTPTYLAVSATLLQGGRGYPSPGFNSPTGYYRWLDKYQPIVVIGYSIFVYKIQ